jgi:hypothetical protein
VKSEKTVSIPDRSPGSIPITFPYGKKDMGFSLRHYATESVKKEGDNNENIEENERSRICCSNTEYLLCV